VRAGPDDDDGGIPAVGRPDGIPFSEGSGKFRVRTRAAPTELEAQTPLTFTLTVEAAGPVQQAPRRIDLTKVPAVAVTFYIEDGPERQPRPDLWEFDYRLKPRRAGVREVPGVPFAYYDPDLGRTGRGFQVIYTDAIPLTVRPRTAVAVPLRAPPEAFRLEPTADVLAHPLRLSAPGPAATAAILLLPPLGCAAWYGLWRRLRPDAFRLEHRRRSRAARRALQRLSALRGGDRAADATAAVTGYLHERLDLATAEPTPAEAYEHLRRHGLPDAIADRAAEFYRAADRARFVPGEADGRELSVLAEALILAVEAQS
jgi:hypothetical protein